MQMIKDLTTMNGRIGCGRFWEYGIIWMIFSTILFIPLIESVPQSLSVVLLLAFIISNIYVRTVLIIKRSRDINFPVWYMWITSVLSVWGYNFAPFGNMEEASLPVILLTLIYIGFLIPLLIKKSYPAENAHGPIPNGPTEIHLFGKKKSKN